MTNVIVVGSGHWGQNLVRNFEQLSHLSGVVEVDPTLRQRLQANYPKATIYETFDAALASDASAVVLATPAPTHFELALAALTAGKDVFVEKPMTLKATEARQLAEYADAHDRILMVGHLLLYQPAIAWMRNYLQSGEAGAVHHVATQRLNLGKVRSTENVWWSLAPHDVSIILDLLGSPALETVQAVGHARLQSAIADEVQVDLAFATGQTAHLHCSWQWPLKQRDTVVIAEHQMLVYDETEQVVTVHHKRIDDDLNAVDDGIQIIDIADAQPLKLECEHFLACVSSRQRPHSDGWNGVAVVNILERVETVLYG
ncbi:MULTISPECIES: Gfo/Idh/MocA family oxidoreductase [Cyanophyceae]|uniref:Gfo/Idh/MocA family protein n=1 Tax=Cyanophyceae TaxID=3028117 RepID=UPI001686245D|nr:MULTISPECIES: Gfo/Idh/MocA family oxidoreductase [Cyanophyceae]MBD1915657.1 Gfo/Idh/MocA family oxidoreductase [Phormidium sp. FACHB-77]MBD2029291.1 Gfo/Idh/MocA family oxidoreductase [Phormidium sp. FACHB-322]MBD2049281.1 Gfo/Idh/MocA family oxidoreductase [Leptolyngbya sp. FACHB-60]